MASLFCIANLKRLLAGGLAALLGGNALAQPSGPVESATHANAAGAADTPVWVRTAFYVYQLDGLTVQYSFDGVHFTTINPDGNPLWTNRLESGFPGVCRDASIAFIGGRFVVAFTHGYMDSTKYVGLIQSTNLWNWTPIGNGLLEVSATPRTVWAPEWFIEGGTNFLLVNMASSLYPELTIGSFLFNASDDALTNWTARGQLAPEINDGYLVHSGDTYHLFGANGSVNLVRFTNSILGPGFELASTYPEYEMEGPCIVPVSGQWRLYMDDMDRGLCYRTSSNLVNWSVPDLRAHEFPRSTCGHGTVLPVTGVAKSILLAAVKDLVFLPPATFTMGSPTNETDRGENEGPQTTVTLTQGFFIGKYEVTQGEYLATTGDNPSWFNGVRTKGWVPGDFGADLNRPVEQVSWFDATNYCGLLTRRERLAGRLPAGWSYRLPTEAEWEYACRAGTRTRFSFGEDDPDYAQLGSHAWHWSNSGSTTRAVGTKLPNGWGLYDMHGNVSQWCLDWHAASYPGGNIMNPTGPATGPGRVFRGGAWARNAGYCRSAARYGCYPAIKTPIIGFRVVLAPDPL